MEMEFKDNSRRRTMVLVIGVLLALGAGAAAFMLSSQSADEPPETIPLRDVVVAASLISARDTIQADQITIRAVPLDATNETAFSSLDDVRGKIAAIPIFENQPITPNMLAQATGVGQVDILKPNETVAPDSPYLRAVSLTVPPERAVGGLIAVDQRVDVIATMRWETLDNLTDPDTGEPLVDPETGEPIAYTSGLSAKPMWLDVEVIGRPEGNPELYILRMDLQQAEEVALAQNVGAQFSLVLRPAVDTRDVPRDQYGETQDRVMARYNFPIPEVVDAIAYPQPVALPTPFPAEPYLELLPSPSPTPESALIEIPVDETGTESPAPEESPEP
jgi:Flp pilus assembly protein CpaB